MTGPYRYDQPEVQATRKPYGFSPWEGPSLLSAFHAARAHTARHLEAAAALQPLSPEDAWLEEWVRVCHAGVPRLQPARGPGQLAPGTAVIDVAPTLDRILGAAGTRCALAPADAEVVRQLLRKFEAFGQVFTTYGADWRRLDRTADAPAVLIRLGAATAWLAAGQTDPAAALAALNATLKITDRNAAWLRGGGTPRPSETRWLLGTLALEGGLVRRWERA